MSIVRKITCNICEQSSTENIRGDGWKGWGNLTGKQGPNGESELSLCPTHLDMVFEFVDNLMGNNKE